jgi:hypothetical protein
MKHLLLIILISLSFTLTAFGQWTHNDSLKIHIIDSLKVWIFPPEVTVDWSDDTAIKYSMQCLAVDRKLAEYTFIDIYLVEAYFNKKQYDSAFKYGDNFLKLKVRKVKDDDNEHLTSHYRKGRNFQLETSNILYQIDTTRHNYKQAVKYLVRHNPEQWWFGSGTNFNGKMKQYYANILYCYVKLGNIAKINKYKWKLEQYE